MEYQRRLKRTSSIGLATTDQMPGEIVTAVNSDDLASGTWRAFSSCGTEITRMPPYMPKGALVMPISHSGTALALGWAQVAMQRAAHGDSHRPDSADRYSASMTRMFAIASSIGNSCADSLRNASRRASHCSMVLIDRREFLDDGRAAISSAPESIRSGWPARSEA